MKTWLIALMLASSVALMATPAQAQELPILPDEEMHCTLPYPPAECLQDWVDWLLSVRGPINLVCTLVTGDADPCVE